MKKLSRYFWAYLAGLFDGEGSVRIKRRKGRNYYKEVKITNTFKPVLNMIAKSTKGFVKKHTWKNSLKHKQSYIVRWFGENAKKILINILPYLKIKKKQGELYLKFPKRNSGKFRYGNERFLKNLEIKKLQDKICDEFSRLNRKGPK